MAAPDIDSSRSFTESLSMVRLLFPLLSTRLLTIGARHSYFTAPWHAQECHHLAQRAHLTVRSNTTAGPIDALCLQVSCHVYSQRPSRQAASAATHLVLQATASVSLNMETPDPERDEPETFIQESRPRIPMILDFSSPHQVLWQDYGIQAAKDVEERAKMAREQNSKGKHMTKTAVDMDEILFGAGTESKGCTIQFVQLPHRSRARRFAI